MHIAKQVFEFLSYGEANRNNFFSLGRAKEKFSQIFMRFLKVAIYNDLALSKGLFGHRLYSKIFTRVTAHVNDQRQ